MTSAESDALDALARELLWLRGDLHHKLDDAKKPIHDAIWAMDEQGQYVIEACRKLGKSFLFCLVAVETCIRNPGCRVNYACQTGKNATEIVDPIFKEIIKDAPPECLPVWREKDGHWEFPNGSYVVLFGCEDETKADRGRGPGALLSIVDEGGFIRVLSYVLDSVLSPQHLRTGGRTLVGSSPPKSPAHDFCKTADAAMLAGTYAHRDIYAPGIDGLPDPEAYIAKRAKAKGITVEEFKATTEFQREFLALRVTSEEDAVVPEFQKAEKEIVQERERPPFFDAYEAGDLGFTRDLSGFVFGYYDFTAAVTVVEDELLLRRATTKTIGEAIIAKRKERYPNRPAPYSSVIDDPGRMCADLWEQFKLVCSPAHNGDPEALINGIRVAVQRRKLVIHPRCVQLRHQLRTAIYDDRGKHLDRNDIDGHFDLVMALAYFLWSVVPSRNPYPPDWDRQPGQYRQGSAFSVQEGAEANPYAQAALGGTRLGRRLLKGRR